MPTIGKYEILEQLGSGSMGTVYKGRDTLLDRMVAIKTIRTGVNVELEAKERFYREARTCARLNHPHIVAVFDLGEENGTSFIAMELLNGSDFRQLIERRESLPVTVKLTAMAQICEALAYAHRAGVIHRDIKPSNLFLPVDHRAKVVDFGIAKLPTSHLTRAGSILGTPNYMAPEQIKGSPCDGRADLFSAAIVFFEFLTYNHPFKSNLAASSTLTPRMEIPRRIMEEKPDSLLEQDPSLPAILERIFEKALAKNPEDRYATGDDFAADLRAVNDAITQDSSPTFSRVELPSKDSFSVPPPIPITESISPQGGLQAAMVPDNQEWRVSRMLKLVPAFEANILAKDVQAARNSLTEMQSVAGDDSRYRETVETSRTRLAQVEQAQSAETVGKLRCAKCANVNRADAVFCVGCGASLAAGTATGATITRQAAPTVSAAPPPPVAPPPGKSRSVPETKSIPAAPPVQTPPLKATGTQATATQATKASVARTKSDRNKLFAVIGIVAVAALLLIVAPMFFRSVKQEQFVGSAVVEAPGTQVLATATDGGKVLSNLERSAQVNVLAVPTSLKQGWVRVQARSGSKYSEPGYVKTAALGDWDSKDPKTALTLAEMSGPMLSGSDAEMRAQVEKLKSVAAAFSGKPAAGQAILDAASLELAIAKSAKASDPSSLSWQASLTDLTGRLETLRSDSSLQGKCDDLLKQIREILSGAPEAPPPPPTDPAAGPATPAVTPGTSTPTDTPPVALSEADIRRYMATAQQALKEGRFDDAKRQVGRILRSQPQNSDAKALRKTIEEQIAFEKSIK